MRAITADLVCTGDKRDARGRNIATEERRSQVLAAYDQSGLTQREFAEREGINYYTLVYWLNRRRQKPAATVRFAQVQLPAPVAMPSLLEVVLPDGTTVRGSDVAQLARLVQSLREPAVC